MQQNSATPELAPEANAAAVSEASAPTSRTERREERETTAAREKEERQTRVAQKMRNLTQLSWEQAKTLYEQNKDILTAAQRKALLKKLGAKQTRRGVRIPLSDPNG
jgi:ribosomal protein L7/L12